jgi:two-component system nitrogen regulation response regulator GlnG
MSRILVVDDEPAICWSFEQALTDNGHRVTSASTAEAALTIAEKFDPELVLLDFRLPGMDGLGVLRQLRSKSPGVPMILMTAYGSLDLAVKALDQGAFDYLPKPFELNDAVEIIGKALADRAAGGASATPSPVAAEDEPQMLGTSRSMQEVFRQIALVAPLQVPVLITGERGVGKELIARAIHRYSDRKSEKFIPICLSALSEPVLEAELFGRVRGETPDAEREQPGLLAMAHLGTAFFEEIGDIPLRQQAKLLRVLEQRQVAPIGGGDLLPARFRFIAATQRSLESLVAAGLFREDLYYRLNVFSIAVPPLRERPEDIPDLARTFLAQVAGTRPLTLGQDAIEELKRRAWPGNIRELRSAVHHAAVVCRGTLIDAGCLPEEHRIAGSAEETGSIHDILPHLARWASRKARSVDPQALEPLLYEQFLNAFEPTLIAAALEAAGGNRKGAAEILGLHRETLRKRLRRYQMDEADGE